MKTTTTPQHPSHRFPRALARLAAALLCCTALLPSATAARASAPADPPTAERVVAVGDVHGDLDAFTGILQAAGLVDEELAWSGGETVLVQTGDILDRGPDVAAIMDLLMRLQEEAAAAGGRVIVLLGNHEAMNLAGFYRDVSPEVYAAFADEGSQTRRYRAWEAYRELEERLAERTGEAPPPLGDMARRRFLDAHPFGLVEYRAALAPDGIYGRWLRTLPAIARVGDTVFVHGGISPRVAPLGMEEINRRAAAALVETDRLRAETVERGVGLPFQDFAGHVETLGRVTDVLPPTSSPVSSERPDDDLELPRLRELRRRLQEVQEGILFASDGPLWFRGFARWPEAALESTLPALLAPFDAERFVVGHSPRAEARIDERADGRIYLIDTGMLEEVYGGRASALEIADGRVTVIYPDERRPLDAAADGSPGAQGAEPATAEAGETTPRPLLLDAEGSPLELTDAELVDFLERAELVGTEPIPEGITEPQKVTLELDGRRLHAIFRVVDVEEARRRVHAETVRHFRDRAIHEVAAYRLARLLGLGNLPPAVERRLGGRNGSLQIWVEDAMNDRDRRARDESYRDSVTTTRQRGDMKVFDNLIANVDRNQTNILVGPDGLLWMIDHTRAFGLRQELPKPESIRFVSRALWRGLRDLGDEEVERALGPLLPELEVKALLTRRDRLVELLDKRIDLLGEEAVLFDYGPPEPGSGVEGPAGSR